MSSLAPAYVLFITTTDKGRAPEYPWAVVILSNRNSLMFFVDCRWRIMARFDLQRWISRVHLSINAIALLLIALETKDCTQKPRTKGERRFHGRWKVLDALYVDIVSPT